MECNYEQISKLIYAMVMCVPVLALCSVLVIWAMRGDI